MISNMHSFAFWGQLTIRYIIFRCCRDFGALDTNVKQTGCNFECWILHKTTLDLMVRSNASVDIVTAKVTSACVSHVVAFKNFL